MVLEQDHGLSRRTVCLDCAALKDFGRFKLTKLARKGYAKP